MVALNGLTKFSKKKLNGNYSKILCAILNKSKKQHPTKQQFIATHLPSNKTSEQDNQDMLSTAGGVKMNTWVMFSNGFSSLRTSGAFLRTYTRRWLLGMNSNRKTKGVSADHNNSLPTSLQNKSVPFLSSFLFLSIPLKQTISIWYIAFSHLLTPPFVILWVSWMLLKEGWRKLWRRRWRGPP